MESKIQTPRLRWQKVDAVVLFDKPPDISSYCALQLVRRIFQAKRAGHTGTLDPFATGLLPICFGAATRFSGALLMAEKTYLARLELGVRTTTGDTEGTVIERSDKVITRSQFTQVLERFRGDTEQLPPMHSAIKFQGRPYYEYARSGLEIERTPRKICIHSLELMQWNNGIPEIKVKCSKGTYIRTLAEDIGAALGCGAHLTALRRLQVGAFSIDSAYTLDTLVVGENKANYSALLAVDVLLADYPRLDLTMGQTRKLLQGQIVAGLGGGDPLGDTALVADATVRCYGPQGFLGLAEFIQGYLRAQRLMPQEFIS